MYKIKQNGTNNTGNAFTAIKISHLWFYKQKIHRAKRIKIIKLNFHHIFLGLNTKNKHMNWLSVFITMYA